MMMRSERPKVVIFGTLNHRSDGILLEAAISTEALDCIIAMIDFLEVGTPLLHGVFQGAFDLSNAPIQVVQILTDATTRF